MKPRNEALVRKFQPELKHFSQLKHPTLLHWRRVGLRPYATTTQASSAEENTSQLRVADDAPAATGVLLVENLTPIKGGRRVSEVNIRTDELKSIETSVKCKI